MSELTLEVLMEAKEKIDSICNRVPAYSMVPESFALIPSEHMRGFVQTKTHRKKRINKKYRKKHGFTEVPWNFAYMTEGNIIAHPLTIEWMKNHMDKMQGDWLTSFTI